MKTLLRCTALLLTLGTSTQAQKVTLFTGDLHDSSWDTALDSPGTFGRAEAGHLTDDGTLDMVQQDGGDLVLLTNPDAFFAGSSITGGGGSIGDMDILPGGGLGGLDAVVTVSPAGLERIWYDAAQAGFVSAVIDSSAWAGAILVRADDFDGDGDTDLIGVGSDEQSILIQLGDGTGSGFTAGTGFSARADVLDLFTLAWDTDSAPELALLTDLAVDVHDADGVLLNTYTGAVPGGAFARLRQAGQGQDRIAWVTEYAPPALQFLAVLTPAGVTDLVDLGALDAFAMVPTDYDLDGDDDLLISHRFSYELLWLENERTPQSPNGPSFPQAGDQKVFAVEDPGPAPENSAWPVAADLDGDGDDDFGFASEASLALTVFRGEAVAEADQRVGIGSADYTVDFQGSDGQLELDLAAPGALPAGATHVEVRVWRQAALGADWDLDPVEVQSLALPGGSGGGWPLQVSLTLPETDASFIDTYNVHVRTVELDGAGELVAAGPQTQGSFTLLAFDRGVYDGDQGVGEVDVTIPVPLEPEQDPTIIKRKRVKVPPPPPNFNNIPKFE